MNLRMSLVCLSLMLWAGCATIVYERAQIDEGISLDLSGGVAYRGFLMITEIAPGIVYGYAPQATLEVHDGFNEHSGILGRFSVCGAPGIQLRYGSGVVPVSMDMQFGVKVAPFSPKAGSLRAVAGLPDLINVSYLLDLGQNWTLNAGFGLPCGPCLGAACHVPLSEDLTLHVAAQGAYSGFYGFGQPSAALGIALGFPR